LAVTTLMFFLKEAFVYNIRLHENFYLYLIENIFSLRWLD